MVRKFVVKLHISESQTKNIEPDLASILRSPPPELLNQDVSERRILGALRVTKTIRLLHRLPRRSVDSGGETLNELPVNLMMII